jgi:hypothetical protein
MQTASARESVHRNQKASNTSAPYIDSIIGSAKAAKRHASTRQSVACHQ